MRAGCKVSDGSGRAQRMLQTSAPDNAYQLRKARGGSVAEHGRALVTHLTQVRLWTPGQGPDP